MWSRLSSRLMVALVVALLAASCGDDGTDDSAGGDAAEATTTAAPTTVAEGTELPSTTAPLDLGGDAAADPASSPLVDLEWLDDTANDYVLVDAREPAGYAAGHIEGAVNLAASALNDPADALAYQLGSAELVAAAAGGVGIAPDSTVVLYDDAASLYASRVYFALRYYGHDDLRVLDGGLTTWESAGRPLSTSPPVVEAVDYPPGDAATELRLVLDDVPDRVDDPDTVFADVRSPAEYTGELVFEDEVGGHIPGARNLDYVAAVGPDNRFLDVDALRAVYTEAGLGPDADIVTYCLVGARGAHSWFVMSEVLGYPNVALYDGSWSEYGTTEGVEIES